MTTPATKKRRAYRLVRHKQTSYATYGRIFDAAGQLIVVTIERPWVEDPANLGHREHGESRFVAGTYTAIRRMSPKRGYEVWWLCGVPDVTLAGQFSDYPQATTAQMHIANFPTDLEGCVGIGSAFGDVENKHDGKTYPGITGSKLAFEKWMKETADLDELELEVVDAFGETSASHGP